MPDDNAFRLSRLEALLHAVFEAADRATAAGHPEDQPLPEEDQDTIRAIGAMQPGDMEGGEEEVPDAVPTPPDDVPTPTPEDEEGLA